MSDFKVHTRLKVSDNGPIECNKMFSIDKRGDVIKRKDEIITLFAKHLDELIEEMNKEE